MKIKRLMNDAPRDIPLAEAKPKVMYELACTAESFTHYDGRLVVLVRKGGDFHNLDGSFACSATHSDFRLRPLPIGAEVLLVQSEN